MNNNNPINEMDNLSSTQNPQPINAVNNNPEPQTSNSYQTNNLNSFMQNSQPVKTVNNNPESQTVNSYQTNNSNDFMQNSQPVNTVNNNPESQTVNSYQTNNSNDFMQNSQPVNAVNNNPAPQTSNSYSINDNFAGKSNNQAPNSFQTTTSNVQQISNSNIMPEQNINQISQPQLNNTTLSNEEELLKAFIGANYDKITTKKFNFAGFFFSVFYMFYRKMFLYGLLLSIILIISSIARAFVIYIVFSIVLGLFVNKIYLSYAKKKIAKIKCQNPQKNIDELKKICSEKGGTSIGILILGVLTEFGIAFILVTILLLIISFSNLDLIKVSDIYSNKINNQDSISLKDATLVKDVNVMGYLCVNSGCSISIEKEENTTNYTLNKSNDELIKILSNYNDYVKLNIYYTQKNNKKTIIKYDVFLKSNNENISNVKSEDELRTKIGLYNKGIYTDTFTLSEIGTPGFGMKDNESYSYVDYTLTDSKNNMYDMKYIITDDVDYNYLNSVLVKGNKYTVTFEVKKDTFGYEYYIKDTK